MGGSFFKKETHTPTRRLQESFLTNKKLENYITSFKDGIREKTTELGFSENKEVNQLLQYIYDYDRLSFSKEDFQKRKRNHVNYMNMIGQMITMTFV